MTFTPSVWRSLTAAVPARLHRVLRGLHQKSARRSVPPEPVSDADRLGTGPTSVPSGPTLSSRKWRSLTPQRVLTNLSETTEPYTTSIPTTLRPKRQIGRVSPSASSFILGHIYWRIASP